MKTMSADEIVRALQRDYGFDREKALRVARAQLPGGASELEPGETCAVGGVVRPVVLPFAFTLPWSLLVSDNDRHTPWLNPKSTKPTIILSDRYKTARQAIQRLVRAQLDGQTPVAEPIELEARVYVPDNRIHDVPDFAKGVHDALARQVYTNDAWIYRAVWERAGVDVDRPRAEITITRKE